MARCHAVRPLAAVAASGEGSLLVAGNLIGTKLFGVGGIANSTGVKIDAGATKNVIGGTTPEARNIISGNLGGVMITGGSSANAVRGNYIGTNAKGSAAVANSTGVDIYSAGTSGNVVAGNFIGTDAAGKAAVGNGKGVWIEMGATGNTVGGTTPGARNVISGNTRGVLIQNVDTEHNALQGN